MRHLTTTPLIQILNGQSHIRRKGFTNLVGFHFFRNLKTARMYHGVFLSTTKIVAKKLKTRNLFAIFPNITIENHDLGLHTQFSYFQWWLG